MEEKVNNLWAMMNDLRAAGDRVDAKTAIKIAKEQGVELEIADLWRLVSFRDGSPVPSVGPHVLQLLVTLARQLKPRRVLDPCANLGQLLIPTVKDMPEVDALGIERQREWIDILRNQDFPTRIEWVSGDPIEILGAMDREFDLVVCVPPIGFPRSKYVLESRDEPVNLNDSYGNVIMLEACLKLTDAGTGLFVVPQSFFLNRENKTVFAALNRLGLHIDAAVYIPKGAFRDTQIPGYIISIRKGTSRFLFVAEMPDEPDNYGQLIKVVAERERLNYKGQGRVVDITEFKTYPEMERRDRFVAASKEAKKQGLIPVPLSALGYVKLAKRGPEAMFEDLPNSVYLPMIGRSKAVSSLSELIIKPHNYAQIVLDPSKVHAPAVANFFNTALGQMVRSLGLSGAVIPKLNQNTIYNMTLFLPSLDQQLRIAEASVRINLLISELTELEEELWQKPEELENTLESIHRFKREENFQEWLNTLPYPLATILWAYYSASDDEKKIEHLNHFFEALTQFVATIMLSAFKPNEVLFGELWPPLNEQLETNHHKLERPSFGTWKITLEYFSKRVRTMLDGKDADVQMCQELFRTTDLNVLKMLSCLELIKVIQDTNTIRNRWKGHGGLVSGSTATTLRIELEGHLQQVRDIFGTKWTGYQMIKLISALPKPGVTSNRVSYVMGTNYPFMVREYDTVESLYADRLYMFTPNFRKGLLLLPFVKVMPSPQTEQNACYFFNRVEGDDIRFVSYHYADQSEVLNHFTDTAIVLKQLTKANGRPTKGG